MIDYVGKSPQYIDEVKTRMRKANFVVLFHPYLFPLVKYMNDSSKLIFEAVDIESVQKKAYIKNADWDNKIFSAEKNCCEDSKIIFATSHEDKERLTQIYNINPEKIFIIPNGVDTRQIQYISDNERAEQKKVCRLENIHTLLFVASWHPPNLEALKYIISTVLPKLRNTKLLLVGSVSDYYLTEVGKLPENILSFGVVDELEKYEIYKLADIAINPMFTGSGTNIKMLDYFSAGIPVVTTETGGEGTDD